MLGTDVGDASAEVVDQHLSESIERRLSPSPRHLIGRTTREGEEDSSPWLVIPIVVEKVFDQFVLAVLDATCSSWAQSGATQAATSNNPRMTSSNVFFSCSKRRTCSRFAVFLLTLMVVCIPIAGKGQYLVYLYTYYLQWANTQGRRDARNIMASDDWHPVQVPKELTKRIQDLMDRGVIVGFTRPAQFYSHAAQMEIRRILDDVRLEQSLDQNDCSCDKDSSEDETPPFPPASSPPGHAGSGAVSTPDAE